MIAELSPQRKFNFLRDVIECKILKGSRKKRSIARKAHIAGLIHWVVYQLGILIRVGKWGNGQERVDRLTAAGYNASEVQSTVNEML